VSESVTLQLAVIGYRYGWFGDFGLVVGYLLHRDTKQTGAGVLLFIGLPAVLS